MAPISIRKYHDNFKRSLGHLQLCGDDPLSSRFGGRRTRGSSGSSSSNFPASCVTEAQNLSYLRSSLSRFQQLGLGVLKELKKEQDAELMTWSISYIGLR